MVSREAGVMTKSIGQRPSRFVSDSLAPDGHSTGLAPRCGCRLKLRMRSGRRQLDSVPAKPVDWWRSRAAYDSHWPAKLALFANRQSAGLAALLSLTRAGNCGTVRPRFRRCPQRSLAVCKPLEIAAYDARRRGGFAPNVPADAARRHEGRASSSGRRRLRTWHWRRRSCEQLSPARKGAGQSAGGVIPPQWRQGLPTASGEVSPRGAMVAAQKRSKLALDQLQQIVPDRLRSHGRLSRALHAGAGVSPRDIRALDDIRHLPSRPAHAPGELEAFSVRDFRRR